MASAVTEGEPVGQKVHIRGNYKTPGAEVSKSFPHILTGSIQPRIDRGSGRLELARWLARPDHPLTARVMVNRIWQWHFGAGLGRTPNNFGKQGEPPTHPELLDYLAVRFVESGWSINAMHRLIMLSSAYQMSSAATPDGKRIDPANRLWSRFNRRRLDIEEIRDSMLAAAGSLDLKMGGTLIAPAAAAAEDGGDSPAGAGRDPMESGRRTVYLPLRRANLAPLLTLFDFGDAATPGEGRPSTNVAPQALFMMNSKFVEERAGALAKRLSEAPADPRAFVAAAYRTVFGREASAEELEADLDYLSRAGQRLAPDAAPEEQQLRARQSLAKLLLQSNEFIYLD